MIPFLLVAALGAANVQSQGPEGTIVVTGQRIETARERLDACLARKCPTNEDIDASLALAETQILAGKYHEARTTLLKSLKRNKHEVMSYPIPVSDLYRANGRVAAHLGLDSAYKSSTWSIYRTLKAALPQDKDRQFFALMEVAEMVRETEGREAALYFYRDIAHQARKAGRADIAATAELRALIRHYPPAFAAERDREIEKIANSTDPNVRAAAFEAKLALARIAFENGDFKKGDALVRALDGSQIKPPILIYQPSVEFAQQEISSAPYPQNRTNPSSTLDPHARSANATSFASFSTLKRLAGNMDDMWIDVAFRIGTDGTVSGLKVVKKRGDTSWSAPLLAAIAQRRYTPGSPDDPSSQRLERYTYTSGYEEATGTHLLERSPQARVEFFDLSADASIAKN